MVQRAIRYNDFTNTGEQERTRHRYTIAIVNTPREIRIIKEKLFRQLAVVDDLREICDYQIPKSEGLHCEVFSISSEVGSIRKPEEIYGNLNQFRRDRNLFEKDESEMIPYIERLVRSLS